MLSYSWVCSYFWLLISSYNRGTTFLHFHCESRVFSTFRGVDIEPLVTSSFLTSPDCFDKQLTQEGQIHPHLFPFSTSTKFWQSYSKTHVSNFGCKIGGKIGQVTYSWSMFHFWVFSRAEAETFPADRRGDKR